MIRRTFQLLPSVGPWRERDLWARGIESWDDFPAEGTGVGISKRIDGAARAKIRECRAAFFDVEAEGVTVQRPSVVSVFDSSGLCFVVRREIHADLTRRASRSPP